MDTGAFSFREVTVPLLLVTLNDLTRLDWVGGGAVGDHSPGGGRLKKGGRSV